MVTFTIAAVMFEKNNPIKKVSPTAWELKTPTSNPLLETSYQPFTGNIEELCQGENEVCAVMAEDRGDGHPQLTQNLKDQINKDVEGDDVYFKN